MIDLYYPLLNIRISSVFGERWGKTHNGIDFATPVGTDVMASAIIEGKQGDTDGDRHYRSFNR